MVSCRISRKNNEGFKRPIQNTDTRSLRLLLNKGGGENDGCSLNVPKGEEVCFAIRSASSAQKENFNPAKRKENRVCTLTYLSGDDWGGGVVGNKRDNVQST